VALFLIFGPEGRVLPLANDDAYYYFKIARNFLQGHGISFDGLQPTNGFHPLYFVAILPLFQLVPWNDVLAVRLALALLAVCYFATAYLIGRIVRPVSGPTSASFATLIWTLNPLALFFARGGVEVAVYVLAAATLSAYYVARYRPNPSAPRAVWLGALAGLTILGRTDGVFLVFAIALDATLHSFRERVSAAVLARQALVAASACGVVLSPWIAWNLRTFGSVVQVSALAHLYAERTPNVIGYLFASLFRVDRAVPLERLALAAAALLAAVGALVWLFGRPALRRVSRVAFLAYYLVLFAGVTLGWYGFYRNWYFLTPCMAFVVLAAVFLGPTSSDPARARRAGWICMCALWLTMGVVGVRSFRFQLAPDRDEGSRAWIQEDARWLTKTLPAGSVLGAFNAGRMGYYLPFRVVNLDGVVNNDVKDAFDTKSLDRYVAQVGIDYVFDKDGYVRFYFTHYARSGMRGLRPMQELREGTVFQVVSTDSLSP